VIVEFAIEFAVEFAVEFVAASFSWAQLTLPLNL